MPKKSPWNGKFVSKERWNTKQNLRLSWSFLLPNLRSGVLCLFSSVRGGLDPIAMQSNHLLGNPPYTLTKRLPGNLTDLRFAFGFCLAFEYVCINFSPKHGSNSTTLLPGLNSRQFPAVSESRQEWSRRVTHERLLWDIPEIFNAKDGQLISRK